MGMVDFAGITECSVFSLPKLLPFKPEFNLGAILSVVAIYLVSATETIGDTSALCNGALKRNPHKKEMGNAICCDGFVSSISGLFGCTPITSFSQNVGLSAMSGVVNRFTIATGAVVMILGGIFPAVGYVLTTIPQGCAWWLRYHDVWQHSLCRFRHDGTQWLLSAQHGHRQSLA